MDVSEVLTASIIRTMTTLRNIPQDSNFHTRRRENLKSHLTRLSNERSPRHILEESEDKWEDLEVS
jgi:hypothetical protein